MPMQYPSSIGHASNSMHHHGKMKYQFKLNDRVIQKSTGKSGTVVGLYGAYPNTNPQLSVRLDNGEHEIQNATNYTKMKQRKGSLKDALEFGYKNDFVDTIDQPQSFLEKLEKKGLIKYQTTKGSRDIYWLTDKGVQEYHRMFKIK